MLRSPAARLRGWRVIGTDRFLPGRELSCPGLSVSELGTVSFLPHMGAQQRLPTLNLYQVEGAA